VESDSNDQKFGRGMRNRYPNQKYWLLEDIRMISAKKKAGNGY